MGTIPDLTCDDDDDVQPDNVELAIRENLDTNYNILDFNH